LWSTTQQHSDRDGVGLYLCYQLRNLMAINMQSGTHYFQLPQEKGVWGYTHAFPTTPEQMFRIMASPTAVIPPLAGLLAHTHTYNKCINTDI